MLAKLDEMVHSKKFLAAAAGAAWQVFLTLKPEWDTAAAEQVHSLIIAYILGTAIVDHAKASAGPGTDVPISTISAPPPPRKPSVHDRPTVVDIGKGAAMLLLVGLGYVAACLLSGCTPATREAAATSALQHLDELCAARAVDHDVVRPPPDAQATDAGGDAR